MGGNAGAPNPQISTDTNKQASKQTHTLLMWLTSNTSTASSHRKKTQQAVGTKKQKTKTITCANIFIVLPALLLIYSFRAFQVFWGQVFAAEHD